MRDQRAIALVNGTTLTDSPVKYQPITVKRSRDGGLFDVAEPTGMLQAIEKARS